MIFKGTSKVTWQHFGGFIYTYRNFELYRKMCLVFVDRNYPMSLKKLPLAWPRHKSHLLWPKLATLRANCPCLVATRRQWAQREHLSWRNQKLTSYASLLNRLRYVPGSDEREVWELYWNLRIKAIVRYLKSSHLFIFILINRVEILVNQIFPELGFSAWQEIYFTLLQIWIFNPVWISQEIALVTWNCWWFWFRWIAGKIQFIKKLKTAQKLLKLPITLWSSFSNRS